MLYCVARQIATQNKLQQYNSKVRIGTMQRAETWEFNKNLESKLITSLNQNLFS